MFYLGGARSAQDILSDQQAALQRDRKKMQALMRMVELAHQLRASLSRGCIDDVGPILDENWQLKKSLSAGISDDWVDRCYERARQNGATGGKLLGAGGCGFLLLYCDQSEQDRLRRDFADLRELKFSFDDDGTQVIFREGAGRSLAGQPSQYLRAEAA